MQPQSISTVRQSLLVLAEQIEREKLNVPTGVLWGKTGRTILFVAFFVLLPLFVPTLEKRLSLKDQPYRQMLPNLRELASFKQNSAPIISVATQPGVQQETLEQNTPDDDPCSDLLIQDPAHALESFYKALARTEAKEKGAVTRITHYGDSPITNDGITGTVRLHLQQQFGDAGHGFILVDKPWEWYGHQGITFQSGGGWTNGSLMNPQSRDGLLGLGGVSSQAVGAGTYSRYGPAREGGIGKNFSKMDVYYLVQTGGGEFTVTINGSEGRTVSTDGDHQHSGFFEIRAAHEGPNSFELKTTSGPVRLFGVVLENDGPGVVYDSLGVNGAFAGLLATALNEQHWTEQLQHRQPDLLILNYGTNESEYASDDQMERYARELKQVVTRIRTALPATSILIVSPMDRGKRLPGGRIGTLPSIPRIVEMQHQVAVDTQCAFFNTYRAMGGDGTMARWHEGRKHLVGGDLTHPTADGAQAIGTLIYMALMDSYGQYKEQALQQSATASHRQPRR
jgi:lysophospholipase L1-like esterase